MKDYLDYQTEDFAQDDFFIHWVRSAEIEAETFWQNWLETYPFMRQKVEQARKLVLLTAGIPSPEISDLEITAQRALLMQRVDDVEAENAKSRRRPALLYWAAACVIGLIALKFWWGNDILPVWNSKKSRSIASASISEVRTGPEKRLVTLPDGSSVLLKKNSRIIFPTNFGGSKREVDLIGEAFFEVARDSLRPFFVRTKDYTTRVLGTSFNVTAYPDEGQVSVFVKTGRVSVYSSTVDMSADKVDRVDLLPDQKAFFQKEKSPLLLEEKDLGTQSLYSDIDQMKFEFDETMVGEVFRQIEEAYNVKIRYDQQVFENCPVTASLTGEPFYEKLKLITLAVRANFRIVKDEIFITGLGCDRDKK